MVQVVWVTINISFRYLYVRLLFIVNHGFIIMTKDCYNFKIAISKLYL